MPDAISGTSPITPGMSTGWAAGTGAPTGDQQNLGKDAFLKLLVAQLKYQDPAAPTDSTQFLAQTAQFTLVEKFDQLAQVNDQLLTTTRAQAAVALVGREVSWTDPVTGQEQSGLVGSVSVTGGNPTLDVAGQKISLDDVTRVEQPKTPSA